MSDITPAQENVTDISEAKKPSKMDIKRQQIFEDRMRRHMAAGKTAEEARIAIMREDYERLPVDKKIQRLEGQIAGLGQAFAQEANNLRYNDGVLADALDLNFKGIAKMLAKLGISLEDQAAMLAEAKAEIEAEQKAKRTDPVEEKPVSASQELTDLANKPGEPAPPPEEATVFGG